MKNKENNSANHSAKIIDFGYISPVDENMEEEFDWYMSCFHHKADGIYADYHDVAKHFFALGQLVAIKEITKRLGLSYEIFPEDR